MVIRPARIARFGYAGIGALNLGAGVYLIAVAASFIWPIAMGLLFIGIGTLLLWRARGIGLYIEGDQARVVGAMWTRTVHRTEIVGISEWNTPILETRIKGQVGTLELQIFYAPGDPNHYSATFEARTKAVTALTEWTGIPVLESR